MAEERLQKILARAGVSSRRAAERLMLAGRVRVRGKLATELGIKADPRRDRVELDGKRVTMDPFAYVVLNKPRGVVSTASDPQGRRTVADLVAGLGVRVSSVGRLDYNTSGVLLLTNDGDFSAALQHPSRLVPKVYLAKVRGIVSDEALARWAQSIEIDGRLTRPAQVRRVRTQGEKTWIEIVLSEGRNRQVRRLGDAAGQAVLKLVRTSYAGITAAGLRPGQWRPLTRDELTSLGRKYDVASRLRRTATPPARRPRHPGQQARTAGGHVSPRGARARPEPSARRRAGSKKPS